MRPFEFQSAASADEALRAQARFLAGGTTLLDLMKLEVEQPSRLVDVTRLPLNDVREKSDSLWIGALVRNSDLAYHPLVRKNVPVLSEAILAGASPQLRNLATTGGNLLQRTRCSYFRDTAWACNKREPGSGCSALEGVNRGHAVMGTSSSCIAVSPSDMNVALMALDARVHLQGERAARSVAIGDFFKLPGETPHIETSMQPGELITEVEIPLKTWYRHSHYVKVRDRASYAFALASCALALDLDGSRVRDVRVAFGGIGTVPWRSAEAENALRGQKLTDDLAQNAADLALTDARPRKANAFKILLAKETFKRALSEMGAKT